MIGHVVVRCDVAGDIDYDGFAYSSKLAIHH